MVAAGGGGGGGGAGGCGLGLAGFGFGFDAFCLHFFAVFGLQGLASGAADAGTPMPSASAHANTRATPTRTVET